MSLLLQSGLQDHLWTTLLSHLSMEMLQCFQSCTKCWRTRRILTKALSKKTARILNQSVSQTWTSPTESVFVNREKGQKETRKNLSNPGKSQKGLECNLLENILKCHTLLKLSKKLSPPNHIPAQLSVNLSVWGTNHCEITFLNKSISYSSLHSGFFGSTAILSHPPKPAPLVIFLFCSSAILQSIIKANLISTSVCIVFYL